MADGVDIPFAPNHIAYLAPAFLDQFQGLLRQLDPLGKWRASYPGFVPQLLQAADRFFARLQTYLSDEQQGVVADALLVAFKAHELTLRKSSDALFFEHPLAVADYLASYQLDPATLAAALLHDVAEDTKVPISHIVERFGPEVGKLVDGVTRLRATGREVVSQFRQEEIGIESFNKLFQFMVDDERVVLIKLADRRHNMQTVAALPPHKQREKAYEVLDVYAPLAYRLGMWDVKSELEELALQTLRPELYSRFKELMTRRAENQQGWFDVIRRLLHETMTAAGLSVWVEPSPEHIYSLYQGYAREGRLPKRLADVMRIVVLVNERFECYQVLGMIHDLWKPVPGTFDDYIAHPRENLYRSLHTTVFGPGGLLKVRIRTFEMHQIAHHGILARWVANIPDQSEGLEEGIQRLLKRLKPLGGITERGAQLAAYREAIADQIQVFTPEGELVELPPGSTPLDFAYQIHSRLGDEARGAHINGVPRPLNTPLRSGDQVSIVRYEGGMPLREWLDKDLEFVSTVYAENRIRRAFRRLHGPEATAIGREALRREMDMMGMEEYDLDAMARELNFEDVEGLLMAVACAEVTPQRVAHVAMRPVWNALEATLVSGVSFSPDSTVRIRGIPGRPMKLCGTCIPRPGDPIVGNLLRGGQVTVHRMDCHHIVKTGQDGGWLNLVEVDWVEEPRAARPIHLRIAAIDRSGLTYDVSQILEAEQVNICEMYGRADNTRNVGLITVTVEVTELRQLSRIVHRIAQLPNVKSVQRVVDQPHCQQVAMDWAINQIAQKA